MALASRGSNTTPGWRARLQPYAEGTRPQDGEHASSFTREATQPHSGERRQGVMLGVLIRIKRIYNFLSSMLLL
jgi:hypothetical protein